MTKLKRKFYCRFCSGGLRNKAYSAFLQNVSTRLPQYLVSEDVSMIRTCFLSSDFFSVFGRVREVTKTFRQTTRLIHSHLLIISISPSSRHSNNVRTSTSVTGDMPTLIWRSSIETSNVSTSALLVVRFLIAGEISKQTRSRKYNQKRKRLTANQSRTCQA